MKRKRVPSLILCIIMLAVFFGIAPNPLTAPQKSACAAANYENDTLTGFAYQIAAIVNKERANNGLQPLKYSEKLSNAAIVRAQEIQSNFSHNRPDGSLCFTVLKEMGITYRYAGENIAYGYRSPEAAMAAWMRSDGHRSNILHTDVDYIGIGVAYKNGTYYWTQFFASSSVLSGDVITEDILPYIMPVQPGDTNKDGAIDATDASNILALYAKLSTTNRVPTAEELKLYDVNKDNSVDAADASRILAYYAYVSTENGKQTFTEFMNSR